MNSRMKTRPPRLASLLLRLATPRSFRESLHGDLIEEFHLVRVEYGSRSASRWYWGQAVRSIGPLLWAQIRSERMGRSVGAALVGAIAAVASATTFGGLLEQAVAYTPNPPIALIAPIVTACALVSSFFAGCVATWLAGNPYRGALLFIGLVVVAPDLIYAVVHDGAHSVPLALLPPALAVGGACVGLACGLRVGRLIHVHL